MDAAAITSPAYLTKEQRAIVEHELGPAVILGVAGSGKTTTLLYRISRLVERGDFEPQRILLCTFDAAAAENMRQRLQQHAGCQTVCVMALHDLGLNAIRIGYANGRLRRLAPDWEKRIETAAQLVFEATLETVHKLQVDFLPELEPLEQGDFLKWVAKCKGNLQYPNLYTIDSDLATNDLVSEAVPPDDLPWYIELYEFYEEVRNQLGLITEDDKLLLGWECLYQSGDVLHAIRGQYDCVVVDEFQDVSLAQSEILDMIVHPHLNFMVAGDDDQTIFEWRGASSDYLVKFAQRYGARRYPLAYNFRNRAGPMMLADAVIRNNKRRIPKSPNLTQGLGGRMEVLALRSAREMGSAIVDDIQKRHASGASYSDMAILVRTFAQTPPIEQACIAADIPYAIHEEQPFYKRPEVQTLIDYCRIAFIDSLLAVNTYLTSAQSDQLRRSWNQIVNQPQRDITADLARTVAETSLVQQAPIYHTLINAGAGQSPAIQEQMHELGATLQWLTGAFRHGSLSKSTAHEILRELDDRLGYSAYLQKRYGPSEIGDDQAETIHQLLTFAQGRGTLSAFMANIQKLDQLRSDACAQAGGEAVSIRNMRAAKGLEWPVVMIPTCIPGIIPRHLYNDIEEERRLLYVALTRASSHLYVYYLQPEPSPFLHQADFNGVLLDLAAIRHVAGKYPVAWTDRDVATMAVTAVKRGLWTYFRDWSHWPPKIQKQAGQRIAEHYQAMDEAGDLTALDLSEPAIRYWRNTAIEPIDAERDDLMKPPWMRKRSR